MKNKMRVLFVLLCLAFTFAVPVSAYSGTYIMEDDAPLFDAAVAAEAEQQCDEAAAAYGCGIYTVILDDFTVYDTTAYEAAKDIYRSRGFGVGENKNGIMLMLSMSERDYALICYGDIANSVFTDSVQEQIEEIVLDDLAEDSWDSALKDYVASCIHVLANFDGTVGEAFPGYYKDGVYYPPVDWTWEMVLQNYWMVIVLLSCVITGYVHPLLKFWLERNMYTAVEQVDADCYVPEHDGMKLTEKEDVFSHEERRTVYHDDDSDSDSSSGFEWDTTVDSDGFSGRSGKF